MIAGTPATPETQSPITNDADTSPAPRRASAKQIAANRKNAVRSTGPTTPEGKEASRLNALKQGLRTKEVIIPGRENPAEFKTLLGELCEDWEPQGHTEIHMVGEIAMAEWRLRRVRRAELGELRKQMAMPTESESETEAKIQQVFQHFPEGLEYVLVQSTIGIGYLRNPLEEALAELESEGEVSEVRIDEIEHVFGTETDSPGTKLRSWFVEEMPERKEDEEGNEEEDSDRHPTPAADNNEPDKKAAARKRAAARKLLKMTLNDLDRRSRKLRRQERPDLEIAWQRLSILQGSELERIQRYETAIKRDLYRAIEQVERLQRRRRGEPLPPTVNVKVSNDD